MSQLYCSLNRGVLGQWSPSAGGETEEKLVKMANPTDRE